MEGGGGRRPGTRPWAAPGRRSGTITAASRLTESRIEVRVTDSGIGGHGTGQGLATARAIVERLGGSITFQAAPARGTTFVVPFPIASRGERAA